MTRIHENAILYEIILNDSGHKRGLLVWHRQRRETAGKEQTAAEIQREAGGIQGRLLLLEKTKEKQNPWIQQSEMRFF